MLAKFPGAEFLTTIYFQVQREKQNYGGGLFTSSIKRRSHAVMAKKYTKRRDTSGKLLFYSIF